MKLLCTVIPSPAIGRVALPGSLKWKAVSKFFKLKFITLGSQVDKTEQVDQFLYKREK